MPRTVQTSEASITTVSAELRVVKISNKQMTKAVFWQLVAEPIIDEEGQTLRGKPWGWVNEHTKSCHSDYAKHLHVIWQDHSELRRSTVYDRMPMEHHPAFFKDWHAYELLAFVSAYKEAEFRCSWSEYCHEERCPNPKFKHWHLTARLPGEGPREGAILPIPDELKHQGDCPWNDPTALARAMLISQMSEYATLMYENHVVEGDYDHQTFVFLKSKVSSYYKARESTRKKLFAKLHETGQLFIAV